MVSAAVRSKAVDLLILIHCLVLSPLFVWSFVFVLVLLCSTKFP